MIIFSGIVIAIVNLHGAYSSVRSMVQHAEDDRVAIDYALRRERIRIVSVRATGGDLILDVLNNGECVLSPIRTDVLIGGVIMTDRIDWNRSSLNGTSTDIWAPKEIYTFVLDGIDVPPGTRIRVVTPHGIGATEVR